MLQSAVIALGALIFSLLLGIPAAVWLSRASAGPRDVILAIICLPLVVPVIVLAVGDYFLFSYLGLLDCLVGLALAHGIIGIPMVTIPTLTALLGASPDLELAARNLGAGSWQSLLRVTLPVAMPGILAGGAFAGLASLNEVVIVMFLGGMRVKPLSLMMWEGFQYEINPTLAVAALAVTAVGIIVMLLFGYVGLLRSVSNQ